MKENAMFKKGVDDGLYNLVDKASTTNRHYRRGVQAGKKRWMLFMASPVHRPPGFVVFTEPEPQRAPKYNRRRPIGTPTILSDVLRIGVAETRNRAFSPFDELFRLNEAQAG
jgi:hypothetical protein